MPLDSEHVPTPLRWSHEAGACEDMLVRMVRATRDSREPRVLAVRAQALRFLQLASQGDDLATQAVAVKGVNVLAAAMDGDDVRNSRSLQLERARTQVNKIAFGLDGCAI